MSSSLFFSNSSIFSANLSYLSHGVRNSSPLVALVGLGALMALSALAPIFSSTSWIFEAGDWFPGSLLWHFQFSPFTITTLIVVLVVSSLVHVYSLYYMAGDPHLRRFVVYLNLFTAFTAVLVVATDLPTLFIGWEGVGLCSYLLVSFWHTRAEAVKSAIKAVVVNKIGDIAFVLATVLWALTFGSFHFLQLELPRPEDWDSHSLIFLLLLTAAAGKSAQLGLHIWLPDATEGPTPVSALIHAATMVTAGLLLLLQAQALLLAEPRYLQPVAFLGVATALFAAAVGLEQVDIKRVIAYSTCSQLGYTLAAIGLAQFNLAFFHLVNHAFFKALLFLAAGSIIHARNNEQDGRPLARTLLRPIRTLMAVGSIGLCALLPTSGAFSKEFIVNSTLLTGGFVLWFLLAATAVITLDYSVRLAAGPRGRKSKASWSNHRSRHNVTLLEVMVLSVLTFATLASGWCGFDAFLGFNSDLFFTNPSTPQPLQLEWLAPVSIFWLLLGSGLVIDIAQPTLRRQRRRARAFSYRVGFDAVANRLFSRPVSTVGPSAFARWDARLLGSLFAASPMRGSILEFTLFSIRDSFSLLLVALTVTVLATVHAAYTHFYGGERGRASTVAQTISYWGVLMMGVMLIFAFTAKNLLLFYVGFEGVLLPMYLLILYWGSKADRPRAGYLLLYYTLVGSLPFLLAILYVQSYSPILEYGTWSLPPLVQLFLWIFFFLPFAFKLPLFPFHTWLPIVHVEAPTPGSVILASLLLKLGGFGMLRYLVTVFHDVSFVYAPVVIGLALTSAILSALIAMRQVDFKRVVAYSSVAHTGQGLAAFYTGQVEGIIGGFLLLVAHGFVSAGLFAGVGVLYDRHHTRNLEHYSGLRWVMPRWSTLFSNLSFANIAFPGTFSFLAELYIFLGLVGFSFTVLKLAGLTILCNTLYAVLLLARLVFGQPKGYIGLYSDVTPVELLFLAGLALLSIVWGLGPDLIQFWEITQSLDVAPVARNGLFLGY